MTWVNRRHAAVLAVLVAAAPVEGARSVVAPVSTMSPVPAASVSAAAISGMAQALSAPIGISAAPGIGAAAAAAAGREIDAVLRGEAYAGSGVVADAAFAGAEGVGVASLGHGAAASASPEALKTEVPAAAAPEGGKVVSSAVSYRVHRFLLKAVAALTGAAYSLPVAGPSLSRELISQAADRRVVFSDYDDTLASHAQVLPADMIAAVKAVKEAGKDFVVISDRGDEKRAGQLTVFESLSSLPVDLRSGMYVSVNNGGRVYRYDAQGEPVRVFEAEPMAEEAKARVAEAAAATKARLKDVGAEQHVPGETNDIPSESWGPYGYALMLKVGSTEAQVRGVAAVLREELDRRGLDIDVNARLAKNPANPPYVNLSIVTKRTSAAFIARELGAEAKDVLIVGDSMYEPREARRGARLARLGERLSGRALPKTGNATDRNMEKALPGALTLSVGTTGDPRPSNLWVLSGKGPSVTRDVLLAVASKPLGAARNGDREGWFAAAAAVAIIAAAAAGYYMLARAFADVVSQGEQILRSSPLMMFGLGLSLAAGVLGKIAGGSKPRLSDGDIRSASASVAAQKGMPWSQTEYNVAYYSMIDHLRRDGATDAQIELFKKLCAEAPLRGGRFNPWSGD